MGDCGGGNKKVRIRRGVWTDGTTTAVFVPLLRLDTNQIANIKVSYDLQTKTGNTLQVRRAKRGSNDGFTWTDPASEYGAIFSGTPGWSYAAAYEATDVTYKMNEFGLNVKNSSAGAIEFAWVTVDIEMRAP